MEIKKGPFNPGLMPTAPQLVSEKMDKVPASEMDLMIEGRKGNTVSGSTGVEATLPRKTDSQLKRDEEIREIFDTVVKQALGKISDEYVISKQSFVKSK